MNRLLHKKYCESILTVSHFCDLLYCYVNILRELALYTFKLTSGPGRVLICALVLIYN